VAGPKRSTLQAMLVNLENDEDMPALQSGSHSPPRSNNNSLTEVDETGKTFTFNSFTSVSV
jgi:hypothetical protein